MLVESLRTDVIANNLANVDSVGFKRDRVSVSAFPDMLVQRINDKPADERGPRVHRPQVIGRLGTGAAIDEIRPDWMHGGLRETGRMLDAALTGPGFFVVEDAAGETALTRNGRFYLDAEGWLVDVHGRRVQGQEGAVQLPQGGEVVFGEDGTIWVNGVQAAALQIVDVANPDALLRLGDAGWRATPESGEPVAAEGFAVVDRHLERSNVNAVAEMVELIQVQRAYEANQRAVLAHDEMLGKAVNEVASL